MRAERETRALPGSAFVDHVGLSVSDLDAAVEFFTAVFSARELVIPAVQPTTWRLAVSGRRRRRKKKGMGTYSVARRRPVTLDDPSRRISVFTLPAPSRAPYGRLFGQTLDCATRSLEPLKPRHVTSLHGA